MDDFLERRDLAAKRNLGISPCLGIESRPKSPKWSRVERRATLLGIDPFAGGGSEESEKKCLSRFGQT